MVHFTIKSDEFSSLDKKMEIDIPVDQIISVYECAPLSLKNKVIPLSRVLIKERNVERSYFVKDTIKNLLTKIREGFENFLSTPDCNPDMLLSISMDQLPVFSILDDLNQHALVLIPLNRISSYQNSRKARCIINVDGYQILVDQSQLQLTEERNKIENDLVQVMRNHNLF